MSSDLKEKTIQFTCEVKPFNFPRTGFNFFLGYKIGKIERNSAFVIDSNTSLRDALAQVKVHIEAINEDILKQVAAQEQK